jgi:Arc/MetJ-type ribon-helix-helix transcriptional regulator
VTPMADDKKSKTWKGSISLPADLREFLDEEKGEYGQDSKVIQAALRLLRDLRQKQQGLKKSGQADLGKAADSVKKALKKKK